MKRPCIPGAGTRGWPARIAFLIGLLFAATLAFAQDQTGNGAGQTGEAAPNQSENNPVQQAAPAAPDEMARQQAPSSSDAAKPIAAWNQRLDEIEAALAQRSISQQELDDIRVEITELRSQISAHIESLRPALEAVQAQAAKLGDPPSTPGATEPEEVAQQRRELNIALADIGGAVNAARASLLKTDLFTARARNLRRDIFERQLLERSNSPLSPRLWRDVAEYSLDGFARLNSILSSWWRGIGDKLLFVGLLFAALAIAVILLIARIVSVPRFREGYETEAPPAWRRTASAGLVITLRALPIVTAALFLYLSLLYFELMPAEAADLVFAAVTAICIVAAVEAVARTVLALSRPNWRLVPLTDLSAKQLYYRLMLLAGIYGLDVFAGALSRATFMPLALNIAQSSIASIAIAAIIISILRIRAPRGEGTDQKMSLIVPFYLRLPLWITAIAILGSAILGYAALARFISGQLIVNSTILIVTYLFIISAGAFGQSLSDDRTETGRWLRDNLLPDQRRREQIALPLTLLLKSLIIVAAGPFILLLWGFDWHDIGSWFGQAFFGFDIGGIRISVTAVIAGLLIFILGYTGAKFFQAWLDSQVMAPAGIDSGVRDSVRTGVGYLGVIVASLLAISYMGLDFSNLAIVAGALSVGVGFGLQSIVNNFVSGLILLAERPIKVGDWIIVGTHEGIVRRISVRSTEIETFDRANVIVPNSQLISDTVKNWTLHNFTGRMPIPIGVHYDSDPEQVRDVLLQIANDHPAVLSMPEPFVFFEDFADSSLKFILFVFLANVNKSFSVRTDLRIAILKAFREKGIKIPYPQTDVHLRDLDWIKDALRERIAKSGQGSDTSRKARREYIAESQDPDVPNGD